MSDQHHDHDHDNDHPPAPLPATPEHGYWKSLRELAGTTEWQQDGASRKEFTGGSDQAPTEADGSTRRNFFQLMGASMGLAGLAAGAGCQRYEKEEIVPLARRPEDQTPSTTLQYSTTYELGGAAHALIATSFEGRPIHLDGNPEHPFAGGGIRPGTDRHAGAHTFAQAAILHLYDIDRSQSPMNGGKGATLDAFKSAVGDLRKSIGPTTHILSEATSSPTVQSLRRKLEKQGAIWHEYEPISWDNEREGTRLAFGRPARPIARLDKCHTIVTIDCDLFVEHPAAMRYNRDFAKSRRKDGSLGIGKMNRLYSVESTFTNTGALADHRLPLRSEHGLPFVAALDAALGGGLAPGSEVLKDKKVADFILALAEELKANAGTAVVIAGRRQSAPVHAFVAKINQTIGAPGATLDYVDDPEPDRPHHVASIASLAKAMGDHQVKTLVILGGNPVYDAPADLDFAGKLAGVETSIHLSEYNDETSKVCKWHVPRAHFLEAWGDARTWDGTISIAQPLIAPLYGGVSSAELLSLFNGEEKGGMELVSGTLDELGYTSWRQNVHDGFVANTQHPPVTPKLGNLGPAQLSPSQQSGSKRRNGELEVTFHYSSFTYDGRFANNSWLWETPDFLTKVTWDNYALVSPETATTLGLENDTYITVNVGGKTLDIPCYTMPGQARFSIALVLGGGRTEAGHVAQHPHNVTDDKPGNWKIGWNTYALRTTTGFDYATSCSAAPTGRRYQLANTQDHWDYRPGIMKDIGETEIAKRTKKIIVEIGNDELVRDRNWRAEEEGEFWDDEVVENGDKGKPRHLSLFQERQYGGHRWGMAIDLGLCTGCNSCMVACQSENNIPVVGRREVINNREMSWIRIDRYFQGNPDDPHVVHQPLACQQCENAPCEQVCPVAATQHSEEGLNDMSYNRCIGTRYCANNCPYKVRRFNFLDWNKEMRAPYAKVRGLLFNPDVTVRMRGVMEKCTFCVQRIQNAKIKWKAQHRNQVPGQAVTGGVNDALPDGLVESACQQACPTEAIVFGDLADPNSRVSLLHADRRAYKLLPENYTKPRNLYVARVRNLNPKLAGGAP
jgi:molybdopterin-containing oxidoreductase family iron-sulfur binding subunit